MVYNWSTAQLISNFPLTPKMDELFKYFYEMITNIDKLPGNNFKKGAELEMKKVIEMADIMKRDRDEKIECEFCV